MMVHTDKCKHMGTLDYKTQNAPIYALTIRVLSTVMVARTEW